jgi:hypothetical protein
VDKVTNFNFLFSAVNLSLGFGLRRTINKFEQIDDGFYEEISYWNTSSPGIHILNVSIPSINAAKTYPSVRLPLYYGLSKFVKQT